MGFLKKWLLSKNIQILLFPIAFAFLYASVHSGNAVLGFIGIFAVIFNAMLIILTK